MTWLARISLLTVISGCSLGELDFSDRRCPCGPGWTCTPLNVCVPENEVLDAEFRFGIDAGSGTLVDSGGSDAEPFDAGSDLDAGTDSGRVDAGTFDAGPLDTACTDLLSDAFICRTMETFPPGYTPERGGTVQLSDEQVYRGEWALKLAHTSNSDPAFRQHKFVATSITDGTGYFRGYFYFPSDQGPFTNWVFMHMQEETSPYAFVGATIGEDWRLGIRFSKVGPDNTQSSSVAMPRDRWVCVQMEVDIADSGRAAVYLDGSLAFEATDVDTLPATGMFNSLIGIAWSGAGAPATVYVDEFAAGTSPLPCDP